MKQIKEIILITALFHFIVACGQENKTNSKTNHMENREKDIWKEKLTQEEYYILREKGTERPFTGKYNDFYEKGHYVCAGCGNKLFTSDTKFDSHCGWPSFDEALPGSVVYHKDTSHGMNRVEVTCAKCDGHLGHVFEDGPKETTGNRYCMNSIALKFVAE